MVERMEERKKVGGEGFQISVTPPIHIEHDLEQGLVPIQEEPITVEQPAPTPTNEENNIGAMYSQ